MTVRESPITEDVAKVQNIANILPQEMYYQGCRAFSVRVDNHEFKADQNAASSKLKKKKSKPTP